MVYKNGKKVCFRNGYVFKKGDWELYARHNAVFDSPGDYLLKMPTFRAESKQLKNNTTYNFQQAK